MKNTLLQLIWYTEAMGFQPSQSKKLEKYSVSDIYGFDKNALLEAGFTEKQAERLSFKNLERGMQILDFCGKTGCRVISYLDEDYPKSLKRLPDFPLVIYVKGNAQLLQREELVAFVGTRSSTYEGERFAERVANRLIDEGKLIVSGSAEGIDTVGLVTSLERNTPCVSVLGCSIDKLYPQKSVRMLTEIIKKGGAVMSEYPPGSDARWFPERNRIIAGLSSAVYIPEAPEKSGALLTAEYAKRYNIPVYAPYVLGDSFSGCRALVENGSRLMAVDLGNSAPVKKEIRVEMPSQRDDTDYGSPVKNHIMKCILSGRDIPDRMVNEEFKISKILASLTELELTGVIEELPGNRFGKKR